MPSLKSKSKQASQGFGSRTIEKNTVIKPKTTGGKQGTLFMKKNSGSNSPAVTEGKENSGGVNFFFRKYFLLEEIPVLFHFIT